MPVSVAIGIYEDLQTFNILEVQKSPPFLVAAS